MKPLPQSLCDRAKLLCSIHPMGVAAEIIGLRRNQLSRMKANGWQAKTYACRYREMPTDFAIMSGRMTHGQLVAHYKTTDRKIVAWRRLLLKMANYPHGGEAASGKRIKKQRLADKPILAPGSILSL